MNDAKLDAFLNKRLYVYQPKKGYRSGVDTVLLASLVEAKINDNILDIGCGVGVASLCLCARIPHISVYGIEKQDSLFTLADKNKDFNNLSSKFIPKLGNILNPHKFNIKFNAVMCNPPYFAQTTENENTAISKYLGNVETDAKLENFIEFAFNNLKDKGSLYLINRSERLKETIDLLSPMLWGNIEIFPIYSYQNKPAKRFLIKAKKSGVAISKLHFGIILHNKDGKFTNEAINILSNGESFPII